MTQPMRLPQGTALAVALRWDAATEVPVGRLGMRDRRVLFEFDPAFLAAGVDISPFHLRRQPGVLEVREPMFDNLPGVFNDSLPDGWGRLLLDRTARRHGIAPETLTPLDRLAHVGTDGIGALVYRPVLDTGGGDETIDLDTVAEASRAVLEGSADDLLDDLRRVGGSPQGARPKALIQIEEATGHITDAWRDRGAGWRHFLVKFATPSDPIDVGPIELAYARMAAAAGVLVPPSHLLPSRIGPGWFASARFDRDGARRMHVVTAAGLLHADFRMPSLDYVDLAKATVRLTRDHRAGEAMFRLAVFNVLAHNRDDHAKQFSFLMDQSGVWSLAPAYDLTFSAGPGGEHSTSVAGEGRNPTRAHLLDVADAAGLSRSRAVAAIEQARAAVARWPELAREAGVSSASADQIGAVVRARGGAAAR